MQFLTCKYNFFLSDICFHVLASCSLHAFDKWTGLYRCANQNLCSESQLKLTSIRKCHHSAQCFIGHSMCTRVRFAISSLYHLFSWISDITKILSVRQFSVFSLWKKIRWMRLVEKRAKYSPKQTDKINWKSI